MTAPETASNNKPRFFRDKCLQHARDARAAHARAHRLLACLGQQAGGHQQPPAAGRARRRPRRARRRAHFPRRPTTTPTLRRAGQLYLPTKRNAARAARPTRPPSLTDSTGGLQGSPCAVRVARGLHGRRARGKGRLARASRRASLARSLGVVVQAREVMRKALLVAVQVQGVTHECAQHDRAQLAALQYVVRWRWQDPHRPAGRAAGGAQGRRGQGGVPAAGGPAGHPGAGREPRRRRGGDGVAVGVGRA